MKTERQKATRLQIIKAAQDNGAAIIPDHILDAEDLLTEFVNDKGQRMPVELEKKSSKNYPKRLYHAFFSYYGTHSDARL